MSSSEGLSRPEAALWTTVQATVSNGILKYACADSVSACEGEKKNTVVCEWEHTSFVLPLPIISHFLKCLLVNHNNDISNSHKLSCVHKLL